MSWQIRQIVINLRCVSHGLKLLTHDGRILIVKTVKGNRLYKSEKLCSRTAISKLFSDGRSVSAFPLRAVIRMEENTGHRQHARFMISVPKKKIRKAVGRVLLRRRVREAYRLNRELLLPVLERCGMSVDIAFLYMDTNIANYQVIEAKMKAMLGKMADIAEANRQRLEAEKDDNESD